jgi:hypothetical protein
MWVKRPIEPSECRSANRMSLVRASLVEGCEEISMAKDSRAKVHEVWSCYLQSITGGGCCAPHFGPVREFGAKYYREIAYADLSSAGALAARNSAPLSVRESTRR